MNAVTQGAHHLRNVFAKPLDLTTFKSYQVPVHVKSEEEKEFIEEQLKKNYIFENLNHAKIFPLVQAFESTSARKGSTIIQQGDKGDYFYLLAEGECEFCVDDQVVGRAAKGDSFGELALLYDAPRAATVKAATDCNLYRVDQQAFRHILQQQATEGEQTKLDLLDKVDFLKDLATSERTKLANVMTPKPFHKDDVLLKKGEGIDSFWILQKGEVKKADIDAGNAHYQDVVIRAGEYMGEAALAAGQPNYYNAIAMTDGMAFCIDKDTFDRVLGNLDGLILRSTDRKVLVSSYNETFAVSLFAPS